LNLAVHYHKLYNFEISSLLLEVLTIAAPFSEILSIIEETISGLRIIKAFNAINLAEQNFHGTNNKYTRLMIRLYRKRDLASPLSEFLATSVLVVVLWFGGRLVLSPENPLDAVNFHCLSWNIFTNNTTGKIHNNCCL